MTRQKLPNDKVEEKGNDVEECRVVKKSMKSMLNDAARSHALWRVDVQGGVFPVAH